MTGKIKVLVAFMFVMTFFSFVSSAVPMSAEISCSGCDKPNCETCYVSKNTQITLTAGAKDSVGNVRYEWMKNGKVVSTSQSYSFVFSENSQYDLKIYDDLGYVPKKIEIIEKSSLSQSSCVPNFVIRSKDGKSELAPGDVAYFEMVLQKRHGCTIYLPKWESDNPDVKILNPTSLITGIEASKDAQTGWSAKLTAKIYSTDYKDPHTEQIISIAIVSNTRPKIVELSPIKAFSYSYFNVGISKITTGIDWNENGDYPAYYEYVVKINKTGKVIGKKFGPLKRGEPIPSFRLKAQERGWYILEARIVDSHGSSSDIKRLEFGVEKGTTGEDIPLLVINDSFNCDQYAECRMDASRTEYYEEGLFYVFYEGKTILKNKEGLTCSGPVCNTIFTYPGNHSITVTVRYFQGKSNSKTVTVIVSPKSMAISQQMPLPTVKETSAVQRGTPVVPQETPIDPQEILKGGSTQKELPTSAKPAPGMEAIISIIAMILIAIKLRN